MTIEAKPGLASRLAATLPPGYAPCALVALVAIWGHHYPAGIDVPQHANLVALWARLNDGPVEWNALFRVRPFTPYVLAYAVAYPFAKWGTALMGIKVVLTLAALGTPWTLARFLRIAGGDDRLALAGFLVVFGFAYLWGFLSQCATLPLLFLYLSAFESQHLETREGRGRRIAWATVAGALLFFCHAITFGVAMTSSALRVLVRGSDRAPLRSGIHLLPLGALTLVWLWLHETNASAPSNWWLVDVPRFITLFSGLFWPQASIPWALLTGGLVAVVVLAGRPRLNRSGAAWTPFLVAVAGFVILPEYIASAFVVGTRFCVYVHAFVPALWRGDERRAVTGPVMLVVTLASLSLLNVRLYRMNAELEGFRVVASKVPRGGDVQASLPRAAGDSEAMGPRELSLVPAWITAENEGLIENDSARYFQMPIQRKHIHFPEVYPYVIARGGDARRRIAKAFPDATLVADSGGWLLFERRARSTGGLLVVRSIEDGGEVSIDHTESGPLTVAEKVFERGLGTRARSFVRVRSSNGTGRLDGACAVDDSSTKPGTVACRIVGKDGEALWDSGHLVRGDEPRRFSVPLDLHGEALLETIPSRGFEHEPVDWVDLH